MVATVKELELLKKQHAEWDRLLKEEESRPLPDDALIQRYKKHKLKIKDEISETENELFNMGLDKSDKKFSYKK